MFVFTILYLGIFTILAIINRNYEFLYYTVVLSGLITIIVFYYKQLRLSESVILGLTILGAIHIFGGNLYFAGTRLYELYFIPGVFRYDNFVHLVGTFVATFVAYNLLSPYLDMKIKHNWILLSILLITVTLGIGAFNELLEFVAVVLFDAAQQVGDYMNNALDLFFNFIGSAFACLFIVYHHRKRTR